MDNLKQKQGELARIIAEETCRSCGAHTGEKAYHTCNKKVLGVRSRQY